MDDSACTEANPCGGQNCIVARRQNGAFVHEDHMFRRRGIPVRATCDTPPTPEQHAAFEAEMRGFDSVLISGETGEKADGDGRVYPAVGESTP
jgi:hypothetical protein